MQFGTKRVAGLGTLVLAVALLVSRWRSNPRPPENDDSSPVAGD